MADKKPQLDVADPFAPSSAPALDVADPFAAGAPAAAPSIAATPAAPPRTGAEHAKDVGLSIGTGTLNLLAGMGTLAAKMPLPLAGVAEAVTGQPQPKNVGQAVAATNEGLSTLLGGGTVKQAATAAREGIHGPSIAEIYQAPIDAVQAGKSAELQGQQADLAQTEGFLASAGKVITNPVLAEAFLAEQTPNLLLMGGGTGATAAKATEAAIAKGASQEAAIALGKQAAAKEIAISEGLQEAGPAAQQAEQEVLAANPEQLAQIPAYQELVAGGLEHQEAVRVLADNAGLWAAPVGYVAGLLGGKLTAPLEADIFTRSLDVQGLRGLLSARGAGKLAVTAGKEAGEETIQEGGSQVATNLGVQQTVDPNRGLMEGVPEAAGTGAALGGLLGGGMAGAGIAASKPKGPLQRVAEEAQGKAAGYSAAAQAAHDAAANAAAFPNDNPDVLLANLRQRAADPALPEAERAQALTELQALTEQHNRMLPAPAGFTVAPDGTTTKGAPRPRPEITPGARAPGDFGPGMTEQAPPPKPQLSYHPSKTALDGDLTRTDGKPFPTETGAARHLKTAFAGRGQLTAVEGGWVVRPPSGRAETGPESSASASPTTAAPAAAGAAPAGPTTQAPSAAAPAADTAAPAPAATPAVAAAPDSPSQSPAAPAQDLAPGSPPPAPADTSAVPQTPPSAALPATDPAASGSAPPPAATASTNGALPADTAAASPASPAPGAAATAAGQTTGAGAAASGAPSGTARTGDATPAGNATQDPIYEAAHAAATSPTNDRPEPTPAQKEAGNYAKGHVRVAGLDVSIENPAGTQRRPEWGALKDHYGYLKGTVGKDKDHIDVFLTPDAADESRPVFVVDQRTAKGGFDEHKVILGAATLEDAKAAYLRNYTPGWKGMGRVTQMTQAQFKAWVKDPAATQQPAHRAVLAAEPAPAALPAHSLATHPAGFYKGWQRATVTEGPHKGVMAYGKTDAEARAALAEALSRKAAAPAAAAAEPAAATPAEPAPGPAPAPAAPATPSPATSGPDAPTAGAGAAASTASSSEADQDDAKAAEDLAARATHTTLPWPTKGWKGSPSAEVSVAQDAGGQWRARYAFQTNSSGAASPFQHSEAYPSAAAARRGALEALRAALPKAAAAAENQHVARIQKWLDEQLGAAAAPPADKGKSTPPAANPFQVGDTVEVLRGGFKGVRGTISGAFGNGLNNVIVRNHPTKAGVHQIHANDLRKLDAAANPDAQDTTAERKGGETLTLPRAISAFAKGQRVVVLPWSGEAGYVQAVYPADNPKAGPTFVDVAELAKVLGRQAPPKPPTPAEAKAAEAKAAKAAAAEKKRVAVETERELFRALSEDPAWLGKDVAAIAAELKARSVIDGQSRIDQGNVPKLAAAIHKQLAKNAADLAKAAHRQPAVLQAAIASAVTAAYPDAGALDADQHGAFIAGFQHAMAGKTKSTLTGEHLTQRQAGYAAALAWRKTEEGRAWYEGRPVAKLENTGVDLRRHWEQLRAAAAAKQTDAAKAWAAIEKATNRAGLFAPLLPEDAKPGYRLYITQLREGVQPFKEWLETAYARWYGRMGGRYGGGKSTIEHIVEGGRYPHREDVDEDKFQTDEAYRIGVLQTAADQYLADMQALLEPLLGTTSVAEAAAKLDATMFRAGMAAEWIRQRARGYTEAKADRDKGLTDLTENELYTPAGKHFIRRESPWGAGGRGVKALYQFTPASGWTQELIAKEDTVALPTKATPLTPPKLDRVLREGLPAGRNGRDVTPAEFKATFGFADVGFGTWVGAKQDQDHLNYAFDAFTDLARHFGIPTQAVGFGGRLHFTIGALGHGKHSAHFASGHPGPAGPVDVINLTNTKGDGTVYHEWVHAFDLAGATGEWNKVRAFMVRALERGPLLVADVEAYADRFLFGGTYWKGDKNGDKVTAAVKAMSYMVTDRARRTSAYKANADKLGADYWGNDKELLARAGEAWAHDTLGGTNTYLVNPWVAEGAVSPAKGYRGTPYPTGEERTAFNALFTALTKAVTVDASHRPQVSFDAFLAALPAEFKDGEARRKELLGREAMQAYYEQRQEQREEAGRARQAEADAKARAEREEADRLAAAALAELEAVRPTIDPPPPAQTPGALTRADYEAIFDQAAAELREETQEAPDVPPPGVTETPPPAPAPDAPPAASQPKPKKGTREELRAQLEAHFAPGNVIYGSYFREYDRVLAFDWNDGNWHVTVEKVKEVSIGNGQTEWRATERPRNHSTRPDKGDKVVASAPAPADAQAAPEPKGAAQLLGEAAKLGVEGADEALKALAAIFGAGPGRLNSFPSGFDEDAYQRAKPHLQAALEKFQAAGRTLLDLYKALIRTYGDGIKDYLIRFSEDAKLSATLGAQVSPSEQLAGKVMDRLARGEAFDWRALFADADAAFGGTQAEGVYTPKDAYDALEAGVNRYLLAQGNAFSPDTDAAGAAVVVQRLAALTALLPTQTKRTAEQDEFQQFSTVPPFAFVANWVAGVGPGDVLLEPSAGIGGLAVFGRIAGAELILNELSSRRAAVLQTVFPGSRVLQENAEQIDNILPPELAPSVVVMNPPFSASAGRLAGERDTAIGARHLTQALDRLAPGGRLVAIVGDGMRLDAQRFRGFWREVQAKHSVRAVVPVDGSGYAKYGTTFDNVLIVIDKVAPTDGKTVTPITTPAGAYSDLVGLLAEIRHDRPAAELPTRDDRSAERDAAESARQDAVRAGEAEPGTGPAAGQPGGVDSGQQPAAAGVGAGARAGGRAGRGPRPGGAVRGAGERGAGAGAEPGRGGQPAAAATGGPDSGGHATGVAIAAAEAAPHAALTDSTFEHYAPQRLQVPGAKPHPGPLVQSAAMASVLPPAPSYTPNLPAATINDGLLSVAQIEAVVYAGQAHAQLLPSGERRGFFIGDGTGVGKGREIAGILLDNLRQGRRKAVWVSEKQDLFNDAKRDFKAVGGDDGLLLNQGKVGAAGAIKAAEGVLFTTYDTLKSGANLDPGKAKKAKTASLAKFKEGDEVVVFGTDGPWRLRSIDTRNQRVVVTANWGAVRTAAFDRVTSIAGDSNWNAAPPAAAGSNSRLQQLVDWLGADFDGALIFDEAHNAGNAVAMKSESGRGTTKPSEKALAVVELQKLLPNARVTYVSATGATTVNNLAYASRLGLWGKGTPFAAVTDFVAEMNAGGLATMELVARDMKQMGAYLARSLSFDGVEYDRVDHRLDPLQREIYDRLAEAWQVVLRDMNKALEAIGAIDANGAVRNSKAVAAARSAFWGTQQRFFNQIITAMQMPSVLEAIEGDLAAGHAVVLQLVNTNEAQQDRALAKKKEEGETDLEDLDLTPRDALLGMVEKAFPVVQMEEGRDDNGNKISTPVLDSQGNPVLNKQAVAMRDALLEDLRQIRVPDGPLEILLNHFGAEIVAEVTGRSQRVVRRDTGEGVRAVIEKRGAGSNKSDADAFLADKKRILVFSDAGGTGYSFHADRTKANQRRRQHYLLQPGWRADKAVQGLGRSHRTNQASAPRFRLVATDIPAHKRFLSAIARRLDMLGAMTKGQRDTANQGLFSEKDNLESKYATQAVRQLLDDVRREQVPGLSFMPFLRQLGLEGLLDPNTGNIPEDKFPPTRQFLNRMLSLTLDMQQTVFDAFIERMEEKIEVAAQRGELDAGMQTVRALETRVVQDETVYTDARTGATTRFVELELTLPNRMYDFPEAKASRQIEWVQNKASGRVWAKIKSGTETTKDGKVLDKFRLLGTSGLQVKTEAEFAGGGYAVIDEDKARALWQEETAARPATVTKPAYMIVGALLPIWDRIKTEGTLQVMRTQTTDGQRLLGRVVQAKDVAEIRKRLDVSSPAAKLAPVDVMAALLKGQVAQLANGWRLQRARVSDEIRIELKAGSLFGALLKELTDLGVIQERINWENRLFVPTGAAGVPVLTELLASKPVVDLADPNAGAADEAPAVFRTRDPDSGRFTGTALPREQVQAIVDRLSAGMAGLTTGGFRIEVAADFDALPAKIRADALAQGAKPHKVSGALDRGVLWIVAANAASARAVEETVFHEAYGHAGMRLLFGRQTMGVMAGMARALGGVSGIQRYAARHKIKLDHYVAGIVERTDLSQEVKLGVLMDELLAHLAERGEPGLRQRALELLGMVRAWLREHGFAALAALTEADLAHLLRRARRAVQAAPTPAPRSEAQARVHTTAQQSEAARLQVAFHGTPQRDIERFSLHRIGSGEGNRTFGWGLYFASQQAVADHYRRRLTRADGSPAQPTGLLASDPQSVEALLAAREAFERRLVERLQAAPDDAARQDVQRELAQVRREIRELASAPAGQTYAVEIPEDTDLLDWDKPLSAQPAKAAAAIASIVNSGLLDPEAVREWQAAAPDQRTGKRFYTVLSQSDYVNGAQGASEALRAAGIPGLRYLDGDSRAGGAGSANYVLWDEDAVSPPRALFRLDDETEVEVFLNNGSGESAASIEAQNRLRDEALLGRARMVLERDGSVRPLFGVDAVDTFARPGQLIVQRGVGREPWTVISQDASLTPDLIAGRLNAARAALEDAFAEWQADLTLFQILPPDRASGALGAIQQGLAPDPKLLERLKSKVEDWRPAWLGALTLQHLAELGEKLLPQIGRYNTVTKAMAAARNTMMAASAELADRWSDFQAKEPVAAALLAQLMHDTTIAGVDPSAAAFVPQVYDDDLGPVEIVSPASTNRRIRELEGRIARSEDLTFQHNAGVRIERLRARLAEETARRAAYPALVARWTDLPAAAQRLYVEVRTAYEDANKATLQALVDRIGRMTLGDAARAALTESLRKKFEAHKVQGPYFPLARFGEFWHAVEDASGEPAFFMYETHREWKAARATLASRGFRVVKSGRKIAKARPVDGASGSFVAEVDAILAGAGVDEDLRDEVYQLYLRTLPDLSQRKHFIHRKKVEGYSDDALRAFGANMFHTAHQLARLQHSDQLDTLVREAQGAAAALAETDPEAAQRAAALFGELTKRHDWVLNPRDSKLVSQITGAGFVYYLGVTPAAALTNMTQLLVTGLPVLGSRYGFRASAAELGRAARFVTSHLKQQRSLGDALTGEEREAYRVWKAEGLIDDTVSHHLAGLAEADTSQYSRGQEKVMAVVSFAFHRTEMFNRQVNALAAYRLARKGGLGHEAATEYAAKAVWEAHYDYSNANRARFMQGNAAKILLLFRQYALNTTWYLVRNFHQGLLAADVTPQEKLEAQKKLAGTLGMTGLFAGALGLPMMWAVFGVLNALHALLDDDDEPWDAETAFQNWLAETTSPQVAQTLTRGVGNGVFGVDLASRTSLNHLWLREADRELEGMDQYHYWLDQLAGPIGGMAANLLRAKQLVQDGQIERGIETAVPKVIKDGLKAWRYATQGVNTLRGDPLVENVGFGEVLTQLTGFTPARVAQRYDANRAVKNYEQAVLDRRQRLLEGFALAVRLGDTELTEKAQAKVMRWNLAHPELPIDEATLKRSLAARLRYSLQSEDGINLNPRLAQKARAQGAFAED